MREKRKGNGEMGEVWFYVLGVVMCCGGWILVGADDGDQLRCGQPEARIFFKDSPGDQMW